MKYIAKYLARQKDISYAEACEILKKRSQRKYISTSDFLREDIRNEQTKNTSIIQK